MERIRLTGLGGDTALTLPMIACVGQEAWKAKEGHASRESFPNWGERALRGMLWEVQTAMPLVLSGGDAVILNHPDSLATLRRNVAKLSQWTNEENR